MEIFLADEVYRVLGACLFLLGIFGVIFQEQGKRATYKAITILSAAWLLELFQASETPSKPLPITLGVLLIVSTVIFQMSSILFRWIEIRNKKGNDWPWN